MRRAHLAATALLATACASAPPPAAVATWTGGPPPPPLPQAPAGRPARVVERTLSNGLRLKVIERRQRPVVMVRLVLGQGSAADPPGGVGATFFAVALLGERYEIDGAGEEIGPGEDTLRHLVWATGAQLDFAVEADHATLGVDGYAQDVEHYLELLGRAVRRPRQGSETFSAYREAVYNALEDVEAGDDLSFVRVLQEAAFGAGHAYARSRFGGLDDLKKLGHEQVVEQQERLLTPGNAALVVAGDVDAAQILRAAEQHLGPWRGRYSPLSLRIPPPAVGGRKLATVIPRRPAESMNLCAARPLSDVVGRDAELALLADVLGGGVDSRLSHALRTERGLAYGSGALIIRRRQARALLACTRVLSADAPLALEVMLRVLGEVSTRPPGVEELQRARARLIGEIEAEQDSLDDLLDVAVQGISLADETPAATRIAALRLVTPEGLTQLAAQVLAPGSLQVVLAGSPAAADRAARGAGLGGVRVLREVRR